MAQENFLHTTHRTVAWFVRAFENNQLELRPPYQRNVVWTDNQRAFLVDTILSSLPIPELYMQDIVDAQGEERHLVVDGQQRITAVLGFVNGEFSLDGDEVSRNWRGLKFGDLLEEQKKVLYSYKFVVRVLPDISDEEVRLIFARINRNVEALNDQELRNAVYSGPFIRTVRRIADEDPFWAEAGLFTANDHRRMIDQEYISELMLAYLHGPQNKKDRLETTYQLYESDFEEQDRVEASFRKVTGEIAAVLPDLKQTRWRKKSDFYTLFLWVAAREIELPWNKEKREEFGLKVRAFGQGVDRLIRLEENEWPNDADPRTKYARAVARAASDKGQRIARTEALDLFLNEEDNAQDSPIFPFDMPPEEPVGNLTA